MRTLRFILKGRTAFFKNPEVNTYFYYTFGNIHKPALLGMFGAISGYGGYSAHFGYDGKVKNNRTDYPEYYEKLAGLRVSVVPANKRGYFPKKIQIFNNSVGYANKDGGLLNIKEQWLENPEWTVYVLIDNDEAEKLSAKIMNQSCTYIPYLGKNDHPADIDKQEIIELYEIDPEGEIINSLSIFDNAEFNDDDMGFRYVEYLPTGLKVETNHYVMEKFVLTDAVIERTKDKVYSDGVNNVVFY